MINDIEHLSFVSNLSIFFCAVTIHFLKNIQILVDSYVVVGN
jgi:hypothetical protein